MEKKMTITKAISEEYLYPAETALNSISWIYFLKDC